MGSKRSILKVILVILVIIFLVFGAGLYYLLSHLNSIIAQLKPEIEKELSKSLKAKVEIGSIKANVFPKTYLTVLNVRILPAKRASSKDKGITFDKLEVKADLSKVLKGELAVNSVSFLSPKITVVQDKDKKFYVEGLKPLFRKPSSEKKISAEAESKKKSAVKEKKSALVVSLNKVEVKKALVTLKLLKGTYKLKNINFSFNGNIEKDFAKGEIFLALNALDSFFRMKVKGLTAKGDDIQVAQGELEAPFGRLSFEGSIGSKNDFKVSSSGISIEKVLALGEKAGFSNLPKIAGKATLQAHSKGHGKNYFATSQIVLRNVSFTGSDNKVIIKSLNGKVGAETRGKEIKLTLSNLEIVPKSLQYILSGEGTFFKEKKSSSFKLKLVEASGEGVVETSGEVLLNQPLTYRIQASGGKIKIKPVMKEFLSGEVTDMFEGTVESFKKEYEGAFYKEFSKTLNAVKGQGEAQVVKGEIRVPNLIREILKKALELGILRSTEGVAGLDDENTKFDSLDLKYAIDKGSLYILNLSLRSPLADMNGKGRVKLLNGEYSFILNTAFSKVLSQELAKRAKEFKYAMNRDGKVVLPVKVTGKGSSIKVFPDFKKLLKRAGENIIKEKAGEFLGGFLGEKKGSKKRLKPKKRKKGLEGILGF
ncbi:MAG: hypothetical protein D6780_01090 [Candidatus Dadabacteria bacterium]|nr:MAG: hypothetical protein D6780_01090 [Candidatus Dadabacteria bacterium]